MYRLFNRSSLFAVKAMRLRRTTQEGLGWTGQAEYYGWLSKEIEPSE